MPHGAPCDEAASPSSSAPLPTGALSIRKNSFQRIVKKITEELVIKTPSSHSLMNKVEKATRV